MSNEVHESWIICAEPNKYRYKDAICDAFKTFDGQVDWHRRETDSFSIGDIVYIHENRSHIRFQTVVVKTDVPEKELFKDECFFNVKEETEKKSMRRGCGRIVGHN